jgi:hypothetical protein
MEGWPLRVAFASGVSAPAALKLKSLDVYQDGSMSIEPSWALHFTGLTPLQPKPAFSSLDRVSLVPTAEPWAVRPGPEVSVALAGSAGSAGFQVSAPERASADHYVVGCDFLDLTFYFSFAGLSVDGKLLQSCYP